MKIKFCGAARCVTGSCHMIEYEGGKLLVDCGMRQGADEKTELGAASFPFDPGEISTVLLTHAHIDHSGLLPLLVRRGFQGKIVTTKATAELSGIMLPDSGHIQEQEAEYQNRKNLRAGKPQVEPLYTVNDAMETLKYFQPVSYGDITEIMPGVRARFNDVGHLLGSAAIEIWVKEKENATKIVFSGDIGRDERPILRDPQRVEDADYLVIEGTYGDRDHEVTAETDKEEQLVGVLRQGMARGGNIVIPSFAVGRTQELLYYIKRIMQRGELPGLDRVPVFVDSPLGISATKVYERCAREYYDEEALEMLKSGSPFDFPSLHVTETAEESKLINFQPGCNIIISSSGMCDAGRIRHHLKHNLFRVDSTILFVGYQAEGTLGRMLLNGVKKVKLFGEEIHVNAAICQMDGFSGHAGRSELLGWIKEIGKKPQCVFLVHGESETLDHFAADIRAMGYEVEIPGLLDVFELKPAAQGKHSLRIPALTTRKAAAPDAFIGRTLNEIVRKWELNGAFAAKRNGEPLHDAALGVADAQKQTLVTMHSTFAAGGITKTFTAACALLLAQQGTLCLDDTISKYVPEYSHGGEITWRDLLTGQKSVPDYMERFVAGRLYREQREQGMGGEAAIRHEWSGQHRAFTNGEVLAMINGLAVEEKDASDFEPGTASDFRLLGMALERSSGLSLAQLMEKQLFQPLGMEETAFGGVPYAQYRVGYSGREIALDAPANLGGEDGLLISCADLTKWMEALQTGALLNKESEKILFAPDSACGFEYMNGWYYADAGFAHAQSAAYLSREYGVAFAVLSNAPGFTGQDETGAFSLCQRLRREMDNVYLTCKAPKLEPVTEDNFYEVLKLQTTGEQTRYVTTNAVSLAQAYAMRQIARPFVLTEHGVAVGFLMLYADKKTRKYKIWRVMVDHRFQGRGFGKALMNLALKKLRQMGAKHVELSVVPGNEAAEKLYLGTGFRYTDKLEDGEVYMEMDL